MIAAMRAISVVSLLVSTASGPAVAVAASLNVGSGANQIVVTAEATGPAGNAIAIEFLGIPPGATTPGSLALTDTAGAPQVQLAYSAPVKATKLYTLGAGSMSVTANVAGAGGNALWFFAVNAMTNYYDASAYPPYIAIEYADGGGEDPAATISEIVALINANSPYVTAEVVSGGDEVMAPANGQLESGANSAVTSTTADVAGCLDASTQVSATGGSTGIAAALAHTHLDGGV